MKIYIDLLLLATIVIYIVDLSGFTDSWRSLVASKLHIKSLRPLPPFDCSLCMVWWSCLIYALINGQFTLPVIAWSALLSFLSIPIGQIIISIREGLIALINKLMP